MTDGPGLVWMKINAYGILPIAGVFYTIGAIVGVLHDGGLFGVALYSCLALSAIGSSVGLIKRNIWGIRLFWVALILSFVVVTLKRAERQQMDGASLLSLAIACGIWIWIYKVYWGKRKQLFT